MYWWISAASARAEARSWPNGFSTTTRAPAGQPGAGQVPDHHPEQRGRDLEIEDRVLARPRSRRAGARRCPRCRSRPTRRRAARRSARTPPRRCSPRSLRSSVRARSRSCSMVQSSPATPMIGQSSSLRCSRRYSEWKVITFARSPVMPKITSRSASACSLAARRLRGCRRVRASPCPVARNDTALPCSRVAAVRMTRLETGAHGHR